MSSRYLSDCLVKPTRPFQIIGTQTVGSSITELELNGSPEFLFSAFPLPSQNLEESHHGVDFGERVIDLQRLEYRFLYLRIRLVLQ